jgi:hypothetical protein
MACLRRVEDRAFRGLTAHPCRAPAPAGTASKAERPKRSGGRRSRCGRRRGVAVASQAGRERGRSTRRGQPRIADSGGGALPPRSGAGSAGGQMQPRVFGGELIPQPCRETP